MGRYFSPREASWSAAVLCRFLHAFHTRPFADQIDLLYSHHVRTSNFDYTLPEELIAQHPAPRREASRLLVLHRSTSALRHLTFPDLLQFVRRGDVLVLNDSKVIRARLRARHSTIGRAFQVLLVQENAPDDWWTMMRPGRRAPVGTRLSFVNRRGENSPLRAVVTKINAEGHRRIRFEGTPDIFKELQSIGEVPLPPYIHRSADQELSADNERYQTVYAREPGSVAAPTAGLHFTPELLDRISGAGIEMCYITLHVGLGTFAPVKAEKLSAHIMHEERFSVTEEAAKTINDCKQSGGRVVAVGTTTLRVLETVAAHTGGAIEGGSGTTRLFIHPPYQFRSVDALLTNFHLPRSTLLMLVCAFACPGKTDGRELVLRAYAEAIKERYRFFSYGDAMLLL